MANYRPKPCAECGGVFWPTGSSAKFCGAGCRAAVNRKRFHAMTPEQTASINVAKRARHRNRTPEQRAMDRTSRAERYRNMTPEQRAANKASAAERHRNRTPEQRAMDRARRAERPPMTPEQRAAKNAREAERRHEQRAAAKAFYQLVDEAKQGRLAERILDSALARLAEDDHAND